MIVFLVISFYNLPNLYPEWSFRWKWKCLALLTASRNLSVNSPLTPRRWHCADSFLWNLIPWRPLPWLKVPSPQTAPMLSGKWLSSPGYLMNAWFGCLLYVWTENYYTQFNLSWEFLRENGFIAAQFFCHLLFFFKFCHISAKHFLIGSHGFNRKLWNILTMFIEWLRYIC